MKRTNTRILLLLVVGLFLFCPAAQVNGAIITGIITNWRESGPMTVIGDDNNHVTMWWSYNTPGKGWFYGRWHTGDSDVAYAEGITDITQITDASIFTFNKQSVGPLCDAQADRDGPGDFVIWRNVDTSYYGALRIDDINSRGLTGTWWFQTDGTANFVPEPATILLLGLGGLLARKRSHG